ncbi:N-acetylmuramoyl-L-alanine amidase [Salegentibacter sp. BDJ18]|uniref:peptidoglycan recognition protein family protein n=1 Tax=Salegentibacter sp. BDJ18 TaxID=2816376 RepID=UPI001AAF3942|nr:peptidoglycan recognition family protein [Salegentibacter sp. BDJ18]MBO2546092.1 N-acetylmuramoyl-L-alanine amidase [Salegentibacter sp. BDJ18]
MKIRAKNIKYIVIHCTAGHKSAEKVQSYFLRPKYEGGRGWNTGGYHIIIEKDGSIKQMYPFEQITNGVRGFNSECIHISYVGGVDEKNVNIAKDTRTISQNKAIQKSIIDAITWLKQNGKDITEDLMILGHRDFSADQNRNNIIEPYERIKECPSFDAKADFNGVYGATGSIQTLPSNR